jgi:transcriptional regulator with XRE-family HTH domain
MTQSTDIKSLKPSQVANKLGLSRSYASELISGVKAGDGGAPKVPSLKVAVEIEDEFGVPVRAWLDRDNVEAA